MKLIEEHKTFRGEKVTFWDGYDKKQVENHPSDGSNGLMVIFTSDDDVLNIKTENTYLQFYKVPENFTQWGKILNKFKQKLNQKFSGNIGVRPV